MLKLSLQLALARVGMSVNVTLGLFPRKAFMARNRLSPFILAPLGKEHSMDISLFQAASEMHGGMWETTCILVSRAADPQTLSGNR